MNCTALESKKQNCNFVNLQKCEPKPLDIIQELWHNTVVAKKTGKQLLVSKPPKRVFLKKSMNPGLHFPSGVSGSWNFASVFTGE
jgi:hypothetical protein